MPPYPRPIPRGACPDCPLAHRGLLCGLLGRGDAPCALQSVTVEPRADVPSSWFEEFAFGIVRRGVVMRQRIERDGRRTTIDAAGPGSLVPLRSSRHSAISAGHAATRVVLCVYPEPKVEGFDKNTVEDLLELTQQAVDRLEGIASARGLASSTEKVRALLDVLAGAFPPAPSGARRELPLTQRDLAELLHIRPETVCRSLRKLSRVEAAASPAACPR